MYRNWVFTLTENKGLWNDFHQEPFFLVEATRSSFLQQRL